MTFQAVGATALCYELHDLERVHKVLMATRRKEADDFLREQQALTSATEQVRSYRV